jgi:hypothetical protein
MVFTRSPWCPALAGQGTPRPPDALYGPAAARDPHDRPVDAGVQVAATAVLGEDGVKVGQQAHLTRSSISERPGLSQLLADASEKGPREAQVDWAPRDHEGRQPALRLHRVRRPGTDARQHGGPICGEPMVATRRGKRADEVYVCRATKLGMGRDYCDNTTGVPRADLHTAVIASLREDVQRGELQAHQERVANDTETRRRREAQRANVTAELPRP